MITKKLPGARAKAILKLYLRLFVANSQLRFFLAEKTASNGEAARRLRSIAATFIAPSAKKCLEEASLSKGTFPEVAEEVSVISVWHHWHHFSLLVLSAGRSKTRNHELLKDKFQQLASVITCGKHTWNGQVYTELEEYEE